MRFALLLLVGCSAQLPDEPSPKPDPIAKAWAHPALFARADEPPTVDWVGSDRLDCTTEHGTAGWTMEGRCWDGATFDAWFVMVARPDGRRMGQTPLGHELVHAWLRRRGEDSDPTHRRPELWERPGSLEARARGWLSAQ